MASLLAEGWVSSLYLYPSDQYFGYNSTTLDCYQYTLVLLARRTCTTLNFNWTVNEGRMLEVRLSITIYM